MLGKKAFMFTGERHKHKGRGLADRVEEILVEKVQLIPCRAGFDSRQ
jgi:hypothetical protein